MGGVCRLWSQHIAVDQPLQSQTCQAKFANRRCVCEPSNRVCETPTRSLRTMTGVCEPNQVSRTSHEPKAGGTNFREWIYTILATIQTPSVWPWLAAHLWVPLSWRSCFVTAWLPMRKRDSAVLGTLHMLLGDSSPKLSIEITDSLCVLLSAGRNLQNVGPKNESRKWYVKPSCLYVFAVCESKHLGHTVDGSSQSSL